MESLYSVRMNQIITVTQSSNWFRKEFDESMTKVKLPSYFKISVSFRNKVNHRNRTEHVALKALTKVQARAMRTTINAFIKCKAKLKSYKFTSSTGDDCTTNFGSNDKVISLLQMWMKEACDGIVLAIGCMAHKLAVATAAASLAIVCCSDTECIVKILIKWARAEDSQSKCHYA